MDNKRQIRRTYWSISVLPALGTLTIAQEEVMFLSSMTLALSWQVVNCSKQKEKDWFAWRGIGEYKNYLLEGSGSCALTSVEVGFKVDVGAAAESVESTDV